MNKMSLDENGSSQDTIQVQDLNSFPALQPGSLDQANTVGGAGASLIAAGLNPPQGPRLFHGNESPQVRSRPVSRHQVKETNTSAPAIDDNEAFPSLGSALVKQGKKNHGKRSGNGPAQKENIPNSLADIVKMTPSPGPGSPRPGFRKPANGNGSASKTGENSAAAQAIPGPTSVPWLETGDGANRAYLKARQDAIKHGGLRNKFLQRYAQHVTLMHSRSSSSIIILRGHHARQTLTFLQRGSGLEPKRRQGCQGAQLARAERERADAESA